MWEIIGILILLIVSSIIWVVTCEKLEHKPTIMFIGYMTGGIIAIIIGTYVIKPEIENSQIQVNELTTELYESYSLIDSLEQEK